MKIKPNQINQYYDKIIDHFSSMNIEMDYTTIDRCIESIKKSGMYKRPRNANYKKGNAGIVREKCYVLEHIIKNPHILLQTYQSLNKNKNPLTSLKSY